MVQIIECEWIEMIYSFKHVELNLQLMFCFFLNLPYASMPIIPHCMYLETTDLLLSRPILKDIIQTTELGVYNSAGPFIAH